jgi:hypothetical protein
MPEAHISDLLSLDRDVARGAIALARFRGALAKDPESAADDQPLEPVRRVTGKSTYDALGALTPSVADVPLRDALREWGVALLLARVVREEDVELSRALHAADGRFAGDPPAKVGLRQAVRGAVAAADAGEVRLWLDAAAECGPPVAAIVRRRAAKRLEAVHRLGLAHPWETVVPAKLATLRNAAELLLRATQDLSETVLRPLLREGGGPANVLHAAVARDAGEGWPAHLGERWLRDTFGAGLSGLRFNLPGLPKAFGASSFMRALGALGFAVRGAAVGKATPFALGHDPGNRSGHRLGHSFAALALDPEWQIRALGVSRRTAQAQARVLVRTALIEVRLQAARLLLGDDAQVAPSDRFAELGPRVLGGTLDGRLRGAWPSVRDDEPARFVGLLESRALFEELRDRFDVDWYRNPRAWTFLRAVSSLPSREPVEAAALDSAAEGLARVFEAVIG